MKNLIVVIMLFFISLMVIISCESNTYSELELLSENPTYVANIKPLITENCISCHANGQQYPNLETYAEVKDACLNGNVICRIDTQSCGSVMPQSGKMPQSKINSIKLWISQGCLNQ